MRTFASALCGRNDRLPPGTCAALDDLVELTAHNDGITLNLAIDYGGRREIGDAVRALVGEVSAGLRDAATIDERAIQSRLYTAGFPIPTSSFAPAASCGSRTFSYSKPRTRSSGQPEPTGPISTKRTCNRHSTPTRCASAVTEPSLTRRRSFDT